MGIFALVPRARNGEVAEGAGNDPGVMHSPGPKSGHTQNAEGTQMVEAANAALMAESAKKKLAAQSVPSLTDDIIKYESEQMDEAEKVEFFQRIVDDGTAWVLQGSYGRTAASLIAAGLVNPHPQMRAAPCRPGDDCDPVWHGNPS